MLPGDGSVANPVDMLGSATGATYEQAIPPLLADPRLDALIVLFVPPVVAGAHEVAAAISRAVEAAQSDKPVLAVVMSAEGTPVELLESGVAGVRLSGVRRASARARRRARRVAAPPGGHGARPRRHRPRGRQGRRRSTAQGEGWLDPAQTRALLEAYGIPLVPERTAASADEAVAAAEEIGYPVVVKTAAAGAHKTETGGVALDLGDEAAVRAAVERIGAPVLVQRYLEGGTELLAGVVQDPVFGPLVAFGPGGVFAELIGDAAFRLAPLTDVDAEELVTGGKAGRLVAGFRGAPAADAAALTTCSTGSAVSPRTCPRWASSISTRCSPAPTAASRSTRACACAAARANGRSRAGSAEARTARRLLARRELPLGRSDLPARQPAPARAAAGEHVKPRLLGHFGTVPGLNLIWAHMNRAISARDLDAITITGPGHGGPGVVACAYLEGTYSERYSAYTLDEAGMKKLFRQFSFPGGIPSHAAPETPGSIHEGGELGYSLAHAYGAAFDNPN